MHVYMFLDEVTVTMSLSLTSGSKESEAVFDSLMEDHADQEVADKQIALLISIRPGITTKQIAQRHPTPRRLFLQ